MATGPEFEIVFTSTLRGRSHYDTLEMAQTALDRKLEIERRRARARGYSLERTDRGARWGSADSMVEIELRKLGEES